MSLLKAVFLLGCMGLILGCASGHCRSQYAEGGERKPVSEENLQSAFHTNETGREPAAGNHIKVYKADGAKQCGQGKGQSPEEMEKQLSGIQVFSREKGKDGMMHMALCGSATGDVNIYEILEQDLANAEKLGFKKVKPTSP